MVLVGLVRRIRGAPLPTPHSPFGHSESSQCTPQGSFPISCRSGLNLTGVPSHLPIIRRPPFPPKQATHPPP